MVLRELQPLPRLGRSSGADTALYRPARTEAKKHSHSSHLLAQRSRGCGVVTPRNLGKNRLQLPKGTSQVRTAMGDISR